ncbi:MAG: CDP-archaeol synthase [Kiritimatiellae bacterium]|nr:CDP-archaeol synthase [Kiritimatiellia bacterium]MDD4735221.1 CDP-archaeol synthase [Kiritimatiellia bacterium]
MLPALGKRLISATFIVAFVLAAFFWFPSWAQALTLAVLSAVALWEFYAFLSSVGIPAFKGLGVAAGLGLQGITWYAYSSSGRLHAAEWELLVILALVLLTLIRCFYRKKCDKLILTMAGTLLGFFYVPFLLNFIVKLLMEWGVDSGRFLVLYLLLVVKWSDAGAYFVGCGCGRHKMIPRISPGKTWEGLAGGLGTGLLVSLLVYFIGGIRAGDTAFTCFDAVTIGLLITAAGVCGDLVESLFKRSVGVKDSSGVIRGMGGMLDVLDSLLFAAPVLYVCVRFFLAA